MLKEFFLEILEKNKAPALELDGRLYAREKLTEIRPPLPLALNVQSLQGLVDYMKSLAESDATSAYPGKKQVLIAHVISHREVHLISQLQGGYAQRHTYVVAKTATDPKTDQEVGFQFDKWHSVESFIIGAQAHFVEDEISRDILKLVSTLTKESGKELQDNGVSQSVTVKRGVALLGRREIPNPVSLVVKRGFSDLMPEAAEFVLRVRESPRDDGVEIALFEADNGAWQLKSRSQIANWLRNELPKLPVLS